jgi:hypothetical protein
MEERERLRMRIEDTREIVERVCTVEGRTFSKELLKAWHDLIGGLDGEVANRAVSLALTDHNIHQVLPKHVLAKKQAAIVELNEMLRKSGMDESEWRSDPEPICRSHNLPVTDCRACCDVLHFQVGHLRGEKLHSWAVANLYQDERVPF